MSVKDETVLSRAIQEALRDLPGCHFERVQSGVLPLRGRYVHCASNGTADLVGIVRGGRFVGLEIKVPGGRTTEEQDEWGACVEALGGVYRVVRSVDEALAVVREVMAR